jgi:integrase
MDVTVHGVRYREAIDTTDRREAIGLEKKRIAEILSGKAASKSGREFARKPFTAAVLLFLEERKPHVAQRTLQFETERLKPLEKYFGEKPLIRLKAEDIGGYQRQRRGAGISGRTLNMEVGVLRRMMKRAKVWNVIAEDVKMDRENRGLIGRVLTPEQKKILFATAGTKEDWKVAYCAAVLAVSTTCRGVELKSLRWSDVDLFARSITIRRSKTDAGHRTIPVNTDAVSALGHLRQRAEMLGSSQPEHFVFPACEQGRIDPTMPQKSWRTAWRSLVLESSRVAGREAARAVREAGGSQGEATEASERAAKPIRGFRFHDLRHQAITEMAEGGAADATLMAVSGHLSRKMLEHYSHVRMAAKREALDKLSSGLIEPRAVKVESGKAQ